MPISSTDLFDLYHSLSAPLLQQFAFPWEALPKLEEFILMLGPSLPNEEYEEVEQLVWIAKNATIAPSAHIAGPCIIGAHTEVRHCAFIRGSVLIGDECVVGNSTELKNTILFDAVQVPHFNYVGDSILGYQAHLGAGAITSNVKSDNSTVTVKDRIAATAIDTGLAKFGALVGDFVEVGCNSVLNPGTVIGRHTNVYPLTSVRGMMPGNSIIKQNGIPVDKR